MCLSTVPLRSRPAWSTRTTSSRSPATSTRFVVRAILDGRVYDWAGPTNYCASYGTGADNGSYVDADGMFYVDSNTKPADVTDGLSNTVAFAETLIGSGELGGTLAAALSRGVNRKSSSG